MVSGGPIYPQLSVNTSADVCVIGGGLAGLTTAYLLTRDGASVIVLEDGFIGSGETGRTTAHLSNVIDDRATSSCRHKIKNRCEQTWDCPCHGSRFDRYGKILNGPANTDLEQAA